MRSMSSDDIKSEQKQRKEMIRNVRAGIHRHLVVWGKEKAKRESERVALNERRRLPSLYSKPIITNIRCTPDYDSSEETQECIETSDVEELSQLHPYATLNSFMPKNFDNHKSRSYKHAVT
mmetsp:Transcript_5120/g.6814  ORF Transcript_5120/g.6814 Transcript_5120/m.6814 type:complete len:121 (+) Transcript_5120:99-461(+)